MRPLFFTSAMLAAMTAITACSPPAPPLAQVPAPVVSVVQPITDRSVVDTAEFIATTAASQKIDVRSRVTGYLKEIKFTPGDEVKTGKVLFVIDRRPFEAALTKADGELKIAVAQERLAQKELARITAANNATPNAVSAAERDKAAAQVEVDKAQIEVATGNRSQAQINLDFTEIKAEINGVVGRNLITEGNLVTADQTILTSIVNTSEVYAYFDVDQPAVVEYRKNHPPDPAKKNDPEKVEFWVDAGGGARSDAPYLGEVDFANPELSPATGALQIRAVFNNNDRQKGQPPLESGLTGVLRVAINEPIKPVLVPDIAIGTDQQQKYVYVVNAEDKVEYRKVTLGRLYDQNLRRIVSGLDGTERVIVLGLQRVRPGLKVEPQLVDPITERPISQGKK